jgi:membrane-associated phospholipid phosphatase
MRRRRHVSVVCTACLAFGLPITAAAQTQQQNQATTNAIVDTAALAPAARPSLLSYRDLLYLGGLVGATLMVMPLDRNITEGFSEPGPQNSRFLRSTAHAFNTYGHPGALLLTFGTLAAGKIAGSETMSDIGLHASMAVVTSGLITMGIKSAMGRQRPALDAEKSSVFGFGDGFRNDDRSSLPSGHTAAAFALATVASEELARIKPGSERWARPLFYTGAGLVGMARIYDNRHWASDVLLGAGIGTLVGLKVTKLAHRHEQSRKVGLLESMSVSPAEGGVRIGWTLPMR